METRRVVMSLEWREYEKDGRLSSVDEGDGDHAHGAERPVRG